MGMGFVFLDERWWELRGVCAFASLWRLVFGLWYFVLVWPLGGLGIKYAPPPLNYNFPFMNFPFVLASF